jgi:hypothetical protein
MDTISKERCARKTKLMKSLKDESYDNRLKKLHLTTMEPRRWQRNLVEVFNMFKRIDNLDVKKFFFVETIAPTRGHLLKFVKQDCKLNCRKCSFLLRIANTWNSLSEHIIACVSVNTFKLRYIVGMSRVYISLVQDLPQNQTKLNQFLFNRHCVICIQNVY